MQVEKQDICRDEAPVACGGKELFTDQEMFKLLKTAMMFRVNNYFTNFKFWGNLRVTSPLPLKNDIFKILKVTKILFPTG